MHNSNLPSDSPIAPLAQEWAPPCCAVRCAATTASPLLASAPRRSPQHYPAPLSLWSSRLQPLPAQHRLHRRAPLWFEHTAPSQARFTQRLPFGHKPTGME